MLNTKLLHKILTKQVLISVVVLQSSLELFTNSRFIGSRLQAKYQIYRFFRPQTCRRNFELWFYDFQLALTEAVGNLCGLLFAFSAHTKNHENILRVGNMWMSELNMYVRSSH